MFCCHSFSLNKMLKCSSGNQDKGWTPFVCCTSKRVKYKLHVLMLEILMATFLILFSAKVKQVAELNVGILTQCVKGKTMQRMNHATCSNILLKVNSKLNGINHTLAPVSR
jgi:hypothetical protein